MSLSRGVLRSVVGSEGHSGVVEGVSLSRGVLRSVVGSEGHSGVVEGCHCPEGFFSVTGDSQGPASGRCVGTVWVWIISMFLMDFSLPMCLLRDPYDAFVARVTSVSRSVTPVLVMY